MAIVSIAYMKPINMILLSSKQYPAWLEENEFVTTETARASLQLRQNKSFRVVKIKYLLRFCNFEWVSPFPINKVVPDRHSAAFFIIGPTTERERILNSGQTLDC